jgi:hypothetical protein
MTTATNDSSASSCNDNNNSSTPTSNVIHNSSFRLAGGALPWFLFSLLLVFLTSFRSYLWDTILIQLHPYWSFGGRSPLMNDFQQCTTSTVTSNNNKSDNLSSFVTPLISLFPLLLIYAIQYVALTIYLRN